MAAAWTSSAAYATRNSSSPRRPDVSPPFASSLTKFLIASNTSTSGPGSPTPYCGLQQYGDSRSWVSIDRRAAACRDGRNLIDALGLALGLSEHLQVGRDVGIVRR